MPPENSLQAFASYYIFRKPQAIEFSLDTLYSLHSWLYNSHSGHAHSANFMKKETFSHRNHKINKLYCSSNENIPAIRRKAQHFTMCQANIILANAGDRTKHNINTRIKFEYRAIHLDLHKYIRAVVRCLRLANTTNEEDTHQTKKNS